MILQIAQLTKSRIAKQIKAQAVISILLLNTCMALNTAHADNTWKLSLKNAYIDRNFDQDHVKDTGSWSQGISLFYSSQFYDTPLNVMDRPLQIGLDASAQYAFRLSSDKHVDDTVLPFDTVNQKQASDYFKHGATLKLKYDQAEMRIGELWLNLPMTTVDTSRQLLTSYRGVNLAFPVQDKLKFEVGYVTKNSPRNKDEFQDFSYTQNGVKHDSDGLSYLNAIYQLNPDLKLNYYYGHLDDLYDKHYLGIEHKYRFNDEMQLNTKFRYFNSQDNSSALDIDSQNIGLLESLNLNNHNFGIGYQRIIGDAYPLPDGFLPELYFINWNVTGFFKKNESSWHFIYGYDFKDYVPGLSATAKYATGRDIKLSNGSKNKESELNLFTSYNFQNKALKGLSLQHLFAKYDQDYGNDFTENRIFVKYQYEF